MIDQEIAEKLKLIKPKKSNLPKWLFWLSGAFVLFTFLFWPYGYLETRLFPVISKARILTVEEIPEGVVITFEFDKYRTGEPVAVDWYMEAMGRTTNVDMVQYGANQSPPRNRSLGTHKTGPWLLKGVTKHEFECHMVARVVHESHPLWNTVSVLY